MKPSIPKGTRDFSPTEVAQRSYISNIIKSSFENFGFQPIETPSFENSSTLMGKYGDEGDRLIFKILNSGDFLLKMKDDFNDYNLFSKFLIRFYSDAIFKIRKKNDLNISELSIENKRESIERYLLDTLNFSINNASKHYSKFENFFKTFFKEKKEILVDIVIDNIDKDIDIKEHLFFKSNVFSYYTSEVLKNNSTKISEKALRYDLTVPFARYVAQHQNDISFPFKRYQIQPVWRADRPQKGRFREFYQCDADVVGSKSLLQEVEFVQLYDDVFTKLKLKDTNIKINNRKILSGIAEIIGASDKLIDFTVALDKLDKIGAEGVTKEMLSKGITEEAIEKVQPLFNFTGTNKEKLIQLKETLSTSDQGLEGVADLQFVIDAVESLGLQTSILEIDVTLARGLNYYTGAIYEVSAPEGIKMGSIGGGGRYDDLTGMFNLKDVSGIGISFGLDRIYLVLEELNLFDEVVLPKPKVLFLNFDETTNLSALKAIKVLRENNIKSELYPDTASSNKKEKKQWKYVSNRGIEFVVSKIENNQFVLKKMSDGEQKKCSLSELINTVQ
ncbi:MAG: histidine--tRNA ligase [Flavobacteriaceae bacterium]|nr:histidine--tRNA ligase [Flavobacteriaceae bacterium]